MEKRRQNRNQDAGGQEAPIKLPQIPKRGQASIKFPSDSEKLKLVQLNNEKPTKPKATHLV